MLGSIDIIMIKVRISLQKICFEIVDCFGVPCCFRTNRYYVHYRYFHHILISAAVQLLDLKLLLFVQSDLQGGLPNVFLTLS